MALALGLFTGRSMDNDLWINNVGAITRKGIDANCLRRRPRGDRPWLSVNLVLAHVSSINTKRDGSNLPEAGFISRGYSAPHMRSHPLPLFMTAAELDHNLPLIDKWQGCDILCGSRIMPDSLTSWRYRIFI